MGMDEPTFDHADLKNLLLICEHILYKVGFHRVV